MESIHELESQARTSSTANATVAGTEPSRSPHDGLSSSSRRTAHPSPHDNYGTSSSSLSRPRGGGLYPAAAAPFRVTSLRNSSYQPPSFGSQSSLTSSSSGVPEEARQQSSRSPFPNSNPNPSDERTALLHPRSGPPRQEATTTTCKPVGGGTILGLHNMAVVLPQFFVALVAAAIFKLTAASRSPALSLAQLAAAATGDDPSTTPPAGSELQGQNDVVWVLRFGGLAALIGMVVSRWVCETKSEREYREYLEWGWRRDAVLPTTPDPDCRRDDAEGSDC